MCGRTCCTLAPGLVPLACSTVLPDGQAPKWLDAPCGGHYYPSTNVPPTAYTPILVKGHQVGDKEDAFVVQPMMWGMIPFWHKGQNPKNHGLTTNNARIEGLSKSRLYKHAMEHDKRCVVVCDGFYEWKTFEDKSKQPYLIYSHQINDSTADQLGSLKDLKPSDVWSEDKKWTGPKPLFMAGLYSIWSSETDPKGEKPVYSYSIITRESNDALDWLHERMPAILPDAEAVQDWLNFDISSQVAIEHLSPISKKELSWHAVSPQVGSVKNHGPDIPKRVKLDKNGKAVKKEANLMSNWLGKKEDSNDENDNQNKKAKKE